MGRGTGNREPGHGAQHNAEDHISFFSWTAIPPPIFFLLLYFISFLPFYSVLLGLIPLLNIYHSLFMRKQDLYRSVGAKLLAGMLQISLTPSPSVTLIPFPCPISCSVFYPVCHCAACSLSDLPCAIDKGCHLWHIYQRLPPTFQYTQAVSPHR